MNEAQVVELLLQSLENEKGGVQVYETALQCAINEDLKEEWEKYHEETANHVRVLTQTCEGIGIDPNQVTPGRTLVRKMGASLVAAMTEALNSASPKAQNWSHANASSLPRQKTISIGNLSASARKNSAAKKAGPSRRRMRKSRIRKTSTYITRRAGAVSCGSNPWE